MRMHICSFLKELCTHHVPDGEKNSGQDPCDFTDRNINCTQSNTLWNLCQIIIYSIVLMFLNCCLTWAKADNMARWYQVHLNHYQLAYHKAIEQPVLNIFIFLSSLIQNVFCPIRLNFFAVKKWRCVKNVKTLPQNYTGKRGSGLRICRWRFIK